MCGKAPPYMPAFQPYRGKPAVRNDRGDRGDVGIIRSPVRASILPDFEEIYGIRGAIEHLRENDYLEPYDRVGRLDLVKKAGIVEYVSRSSLVRILETKSLWQYF